VKTRGFEPPSRSPIEALSLVLGSVDALRNLRALYLLLFTFALAGLFTAMAQASFVRGGLWGPMQAAAALFVAFYGGNAAGILVMDEARGFEVREVGEAVRVSLLTAHRLLLAMLLIALSYAALGAALLAIMWLCRPGVTGPLLGAWLFGVAVPLGVVCVGVALLAWIAVVVPLAAPAVWAGAGVLTVVRQLWHWMRHRLLTVALLMALVSLLTAGVGALVSFVVVAGGRVVSEIGVRVVGIDVPAQDLMRGLFGYGARTAASSGHVSAALVGGGIVFALALVLPGLIYLRGTCSVYLALCEDPR